MLHGRNLETLEVLVPGHPVHLMKQTAHPLNPLFSAKEKLKSTL